MSTDSQGILKAPLCCSIEEASYYFTFKTLWRSFFCALVAGLSVRAFNPFGNTLSSLYHVEHAKRWMVPELFSFALIGVICGLMGSAFIRLNMKLNRYRANSIIKKHPLIEVVGVTFITSLLAYGNPFTKISSAALIRQVSVPQKHLTIILNCFRCLMIVREITSRNIATTILSTMTFVT